MSERDYLISRGLIRPKNLSHPISAPLPTAKTQQASTPRAVIFDRTRIAVKAEMAQSRLQNNGKKSYKGRPIGRIKKVCCVRCHQEFKEVRWSKHLAKNCSLFRSYKDEQDLLLEEHAASVMLYKANADKAVSAKVKWECPVCKREINSLGARELHRCSPRANIDFPFTLLPPGPGQFRTVFERLCGLQKLGKAKELDWRRIEQLEELGFMACHYGSKGWFGYAVYEFVDTSWVILETPVEGNAIYFLGVDWRSAISMTKAEVREGYAGNHKKVIHRGEYWLKVKRMLCSEKLV